MLDRKLDDCIDELPYLSHWCYLLTYVLDQLVDKVLRFVFLPLVFSEQGLHAHVVLVGEQLVQPVEFIGVGHFR